MTTPVRRICPQCKVIRLADKRWWGNDCVNGDAMIHTYAAAEIRARIKATQLPGGKKSWTNDKWRALLELLEGKK